MWRFCPSQKEPLEEMRKAVDESFDVLKNMRHRMSFSFGETMSEQSVRAWYCVLIVCSIYAFLQAGRDNCFQWARFLNRYAK
jgi:hypothetical protein